MSEIPALTYEWALTVGAATYKTLLPSEKLIIEYVKGQEMYRLMRLNADGISATKETVFFLDLPAARQIIKRGWATFSFNNLYPIE